MKNYAKLLEGKYAVVTNGGDPCGSAIVKKFALHGATVAFGVRDIETGERILGEIAELSPESFYLVLDLADSDGIEEFCRKVKERFPLTTVLVNNPYADIGKTITETTEEATGISYRLIKKHNADPSGIYGPMRDNKCGSIINISSTRYSNPLWAIHFLP